MTSINVAGCCNMAVEREAAMRLTGYFIVFSSFGIWLGLEGLSAHAEELDYLKHVKPILKSRCYACHGALKQNGKLRLDTAKRGIQGGSSGPAIVPGNPEQSELIRRVTAQNSPERMPPEHEGAPLTAAEIDTLRKWIQGGALHPADEQPEADPRDHWAFRPIRRPPIPKVKNAAWVRNPIDAFVAAQHEQRGLTPMPEASRVELLRRLYFDLIGLPPTPEEIAAVLAEKRADWYERTAQGLLEDPRFGERWARHWMDIWRYSDWWGLGSELRNSQKHIWHWRDWIIESLNKDLPYDEMIRQMLAADELYPNDLDKLRATGFLARNYFLFNRHQWLDDTVEHVSKAFLGLTMNCTRCHDHKYDPLPQLAYYQMRAFFEPYHVRLDVIPGETDLQRDGIPRVFDAWPDDPTYRFVRGDEKNPDKSRVIPPGVPELFGVELPKIQPVSLPIEAWQPQRRPWVISDQVENAKRKLKVANDDLAKIRKRISFLETVTAPPTSPIGPPSPAVKGGNRTDSVVIETFESLNTERWQILGGEWAFEAGRLEQKQDGPKRSVLRLRQPVPQNFEATLRFTLLGGSQWKSIGISFDTALADPTRDPTAVDHEQNVYVSAYAGGPKIQASFSLAGQWHYPPPPAMRLLPIQLQREYTLRVQVRDQLINAYINGIPVLACRTPQARQDGCLQLFTFDARAVFHEFRLKPLDANAELWNPSDLALEAPPILHVEDSKAELAVAEAAVSVASAELTEIELRAKAWQAIWSRLEESHQRSTFDAAIHAARQLKVAQARHALALARREEMRATPDKKPSAQQAVQSATEALRQAEANVPADIQANEKIREFQGARWTPTRFRSSQADDPAPAFLPQSTGRRSALARWITDPKHPLTARVAVNHIWTRHFGTPLVPTVLDFGRKGQPPTHPELLDWLASELIDSGWSMKHLHRLIVSSATYRLTSVVPPNKPNSKSDPENVLLWRRTPIRMESQIVRDAVLSLAGVLDPRMGGPSIASDEQARSKRRSVYFFHSNNERNLFLTLFDDALVTECYRRDQSIIPQQALALTNSRLVLDHAGAIAERIAQSVRANQHSSSDEAFVNQAFLVLLARVPSGEELRDCLQALREWRKLPESAAGDGKYNRFAEENLIWVLLNHNDFIMVR